jgi:hypothetical protein
VNRHWQRPSQVVVAAAAVTEAFHVSRYVV